MIVDAVFGIAAGAIVTVILDGRTLDASEPARLAAGVTLAPFAPFVRAFADRIEPEPDGSRVRIVRGHRDVIVRLASPASCCIGLGLPLDDARIPLAAVARALGGNVAYGAHAHTLAIDMLPDPIEILTPRAYTPPPVGSVPTFAPHVDATPRPAVTGIPHPRRTPILVESSSPDS